MKLPKTYYNPLSLLGSIIASVSGLIIVFFMISSLLFNTGGSYLGLFMYIVLPVFLIIGLILIPIGMSRRSKKIKRDGEDSTARWIKIDLRDLRQWNAIAIFIIVTIFYQSLRDMFRPDLHFKLNIPFCIGRIC